MPTARSSSTVAAIAGIRVRIRGADRVLRGMLDADWPQRPEAPRGTLALSAGKRGGLAGYSTVLQRVFDRIDDAFALHVAAVSKHGACVLISGPSGFGKTTLALHLALAGFEFLCDDLALLGTATGELEPVIRGVHLRPGSRRLLSAAERRRARAACRVAGRGEWTVDAERWLGPPSPGARVALVLLLRPAAELRSIRALRSYRLLFDGRGADRSAALRALDGVARVEPALTLGPAWTVHADDPAPLLRWIAGRPRGLLAWSKTASEAPRYDRPPRAVPIGRFQAAIELSQEMVNRGPGSGLGAAYAGREAEIPVDLAAAISQAHCFALAPGRLAETVRLVEKLFRKTRISRRPPGRAAPR